LRDGRGRVRYIVPTNCCMVVDHGRLSLTYPPRLERPTARTAWRFLIVIKRPGWREPRTTSSTPPASFTSRTTRRHTARASRANLKRATVPASLALIALLRAARAHTAPAALEEFWASACFNAPSPSQNTTMTAARRVDGHYRGANADRLRMAWACVACCSRAWDVPDSFGGEW